MSTELAVQFLEAVAQHRDEQGQPLQFDTTALAELRDVHAEPGRVTARLPVSPAVSNRYGTLHGGCIGGRGLGPGLRGAARRRSCTPSPRSTASLQPRTTLPCVLGFLVPAATLVDTVGSAALITLSPKGGVSLAINVNYLSKVPTDGVVAVEAEVSGGWAHTSVCALRCVVCPSHVLHLNCYKHAVLPPPTSAGKYMHPNVQA
jgi:acyl-coenzyme A thioesterase PaaI-like protein